MRMPPFSQFLRALALLVITVAALAAEVPVRPPLMRPSAEVLRSWNREHHALPSAAHLLDVHSERPAKVQLLEHLQGAIRERNQGASANAWVWASTAMVEVALSTDQGWKDRLSIQHLHAQLGDESRFHLLARTGSSLPGFAAFLNEHRVLIPWSNAQADYRDGVINSATTRTLVDPASISLEPQYRVRQITPFALPTAGRSQTEMIALIRAALAGGQAVGFSFKTQAADFQTFWAEGSEDALWVNAYEGGTWNAAWGAHMAVIVGYDCQDPDPAKHTWIVLNSWGNTAKRPGGLFRLPMHMAYDATFRLAEDDAALDCYQFQVIRLEMETPVPAPLAVQATLSESSPVVGQPLQFTASVQGVPPVAYQWRRNGEALSGATAAVHAIPYLKSTDGGASFDVHIANATDQAVSAPLTFSVQGTQALLNPGFEGEDGWAWLPASARSVVGDAHSGVTVAQLAGLGAASLSQKVSIPKDAKNAWISWWTRYAVDGSKDRLSIRVRDDEGKLLETLSSYTKDTQALLWSQDSANLDAYRGQTIHIAAEATQEGEPGSGFQLDDFALVLDAPRPKAKRLRAAAGEPTITSFSPTSGGRNTKVTISGTGFTGATQVLFDGRAGSGLLVPNDTTLTVTVPNNITSGLITVVTPGGSTTSKDPFKTTRMYIRSFSPESGPIGSKVVIKGENFTSGDTVSIGNAYATSTFDSSTQISAQVPSTLTGKITVTFNYYERDVSEKSFKVQSDAPPVITGFTPGAGGAATSVTLNGTGFSGASLVDFAGASVTTFSVNSDTQITVEVPSGATSGPIAVTTPMGKGTSSASFKVTSPIVASFTPDKGIIGAKVVITGSNFLNASAVRFRGTSANYVIDNDTQITATVPATSTGKIEIVGPSGTGASATPFSVEAAAAPTLTAFTPAEGKAYTKVILTGTGFSGTTSVKFNGVAVYVTVLSDTRISVEAPYEVTTGPITVITPKGQVDSVTPFKSTRLVLTSIDPASGPIGTKVTLTGSGFTMVDRVRFNGTEAPFTMDGDTRINAVVPATTSGTISLSAPNDYLYSSVRFEVAPAGPPTITSFTPTEGGDNTEVTLQGTNFSGATSITFNGANADIKTRVSDTKIIARAPSGVTTGAIYLTTPLGTATSTGTFKANSPLITSVAPASGPIGAKVVLTGKNLTGTTSVQFNYYTSATFTVDSDTQITVIVPNTSSGTIRVTTRFGTCSSPTSFTVAADAAPTVTSFSPSEGGIDQTVVILGTGFTGASTVSFNGTPSYYLSVDSDTRITTRVPSVATTGKIRVVTPLGSGESSTDFKVRTPVINAITPDFGPIGSKVVITGQNFTGTTAVGFYYSNNATFTVDSDTQITAVAPSASTGTISITTPWGSCTSRTNFTYTASAAPTIAAFSPAQGKEYDTIRLTGKGFSGTSSVQFNGTSADFILVSDTELTARVPYGARTGAISVTTPMGTATSGSAFKVLTPRITGISPTSGPIGTKVTISGVSLTGITTVNVNGTSATFTVDSDTQISAVVPPTTSGSIYIYGPNGYAYSGSSFSVLANAAPKITSFTPTEAGVGAPITILGTGFSGVSDVRLNGAWTSYTSVSDTMITARVPYDAKNGGLISVTTPMGTAVSSASFTIHRPTVLKLEPSSGPVGTQVVVKGKGFSSANSVSFNGTRAYFQIDSDTQLRTTVPSGATTGTLWVRDTQDLGSGEPFTVLVSTPPTITSFSPASGSVGTMVTVFGKGFTAAAQVRFNGFAASFSIQNDTTLTAYVPSAATTGPISVVGPGGTGASQGSFSVTGQAPTIAMFWPSAGVPGNTVLISGTRFTGATAVKFNGIAAAFNVKSDTLLDATVPSGATTGLITIFTPSGNASTSTAYTVNDDRPTITGFSPGNGPVGTQVNLVGTKFTGATNVAFNGVSATFTLVSDTSILATLPPGARTGALRVTTPKGQCLSISSFRVTPVVASLSVLSGPVGTSVQIKGSGLLETTAVVFNGTPAIFQVASDDLLTTTVPQGASSGALVVTTPGGTSSPVLFSVSSLALSPHQSATMTGFTLIFSAVPQGTSDPLTWVASGGSPLSGTGSTFTWTAPQTPGDVVITVTSGTANSSLNLKVKGRDLGTGQANAATLSVFSAAYGSRSGEPAFVEAADLNGDGIINDQDITIWFSGR